MANELCEVRHMGNVLGVFDRITCVKAFVTSDTLTPHLRAHSDNNSSCPC